MQIATEAREWIGTPYAHGQSVKGCAVDCAGLIVGVCRELGLGEFAAFQEGAPRHPPEGYLRSRLEAAGCYTVRKIAPGRILLFRIGGVEQHAALCVEEGQIVHVLRMLGCVEHSLTLEWEERLSGVFSLPEPEGSA